MNIFQAVVLGFIQGITEFLPVSSSGHLALTHQFFNLTEPSLAFDTFLHFGTLIAVIIFFWKDVLALKIKDYVIIGIGTIPAVFAGLFIKDHIEFLSSSLPIVASLLIVTGIINYLSDKKLSTNQENKQETLTHKNAFITGIFQAFAILPGISRSGSTLFGSLIQGISREKSFTYSFLLSIPAILGANLLQVIDLMQVGIETINSANYLVGGISAFVTGLLSLKLLKYIISNAKLKLFAWYCLGIGSFLLIFSLA